MKEPSFKEWLIDGLKSLFKRFVDAWDAEPKSRETIEKIEFVTALILFLISGGILSLNATVAVLMLTASIVIGLHFVYMIDMDCRRKHGETK